MSKIKVMSTALSNRIAAGEVIERPASVVKELVENSIDAGSSFISVEIERAGSRLIAVTDNGCGMDAEDAMLALEQHGTSKLLSEEDLDHIMTLGFRGEALPSIASVSRFSLITRTADSPEGIKVSGDGGENMTTVPCGGTVGTRIEVRDLFFNLPARRKFLKSAATEEHHIEEIMIMLAIAHPETGFRLQIDNRIAFHTPASSSQEYRLRELFGKSFTDKMLFFEHTENGMNISGCIASPGFTRPSRRDQRVFINSRPVEAQAVYRGIKEGYATLAEPGRYNPVVLFIDMPPEDLDVNVHPAKREVRFKSEYVVSRAVASAISAALRRTRETGATPAQLPPSGKLPLALVLDAAEIRYQVEKVEQRKLTGLFLDGENVSPKDDLVLEGDAEMLQIRPAPEVETVSETTPPEKTPEVQVEPEKICRNENEEKTFDIPQVSAVPSMRGTAERMWEQPAAFSGNWPEHIIGVFDNTYILASSASGLVLIDQHAAHERVMFERLLDEAGRAEVIQQTLLIPEIIDLPRQEISLLASCKEVFERFGFDIEPAGGNTVMINAIPQNFGKCKDISGFFSDMLHELTASNDLKSSVRPENIARAACRAAVKAHDVLDIKAMEQLLEDMKKCRQGTLCPHGRPTMITLSVKEIEKRFQRR